MLQQAPPAERDTSTFADSRTPSALAAAGYVNDASGLHPIRPAAVVQPQSAAEVQAALATARANGITVTTAGTRHAQGGQALRDGALLLDMRAMNRMAYNQASDTLTVEPGATWDAVQRFLDQRGRSVAVMQSSNLFSVGGTVSANAHGRDVRFGPMIDSVKALTIVTPNGNLVRCSRSEHSDLFRLAVGGYGMFGTITRIELATVPNEMLRRRDATMPTSSFLDWYHANIQGQPDARLLQARLSIAPNNLMNEIHVVDYRADPSLAGVPASSFPKLKQHENAIAVLWEKATFKLAEHSRLGRDLLWQIQLHVEPRLGGSVVSRNQAMSPPVEFLRDGAGSHTQVLQEYFVPRERLPQFVDSLRGIVQRHGTALLNATIRDVPADTTSALPYARRDSFAVVLYIDEHASAAGDADQQQMAREAAQAAAVQGGSFYLPYALPFTAGQMQAAYPNFSSVIAAHRSIDPSGMLQNGITDLAARIGL